MDKIQDNIWKLEKIALQQDFFSLEYASKHLGLTERRTFDLIKEIKPYRIIQEYNLPGKRGRPTKLYRLRLKDLKIDKSKEIFDYLDKIKDKVDSVVLFGSMATKFADQNSDVDLFVLTKNPIKKPENIEVLSAASLSDIPSTTRYNILNNGIRLISKKEMPYPDFDFEEAIKQKELKIEADREILKIASFPESAGFLGMILLNLGYLLLLKQGIVPSCWKEVKLYLESFFEEVNPLYQYYLKFEKQRKIDDKQLNLNMKTYKNIEKKVFELWQKIKQGKFSIPLYIRPAM